MYRYTFIDGVSSGLCYILLKGVITKYLKQKRTLNFPTIKAEITNLLSNSLDSSKMLKLDKIYKVNSNNDTVEVRIDNRVVAILEPK